MIIRAVTTEGKGVYLEPGISGLARRLVLCITTHGGDLVLGLEAKEARALLDALEHLVPQVETWARAPTSVRDATVWGHNNERRLREAPFPPRLPAWREGDDDGD
jgi:hypothetical protein